MIPHKNFTLTLVILRLVKFKWQLLEWRDCSYKLDFWWFLHKVCHFQDSLLLPTQNCCWACSAVSAHLLIHGWLFYNFHLLCFFLIYQICWPSRVQVKKILKKICISLEGCIFSQVKIVASVSFCFALSWLKAHLVSCSKQFIAQNVGNSGSKMLEIQE